MPQFLADIKDNNFRLSDEESGRLAVLRGKPGAEIKLFDGKDNKFLGKLKNKNSGFVIRQLPAKDVPVDVTLCFSVVSRAATEELLDTRAQTGIKRFLSVILQFCDKEFIKKRDAKSFLWRLK